MPRIRDPKAQTLTSSSPENCARACLNNSIYVQQPDGKCMSFDFYSSPVGSLCSLYTYTRFNKPDIEFDVQLVDHYSSNY